LNKVIVVKIGGATLGSHDTTLEDIVYLQKQEKLLVVVHGGGKVSTEWLSRLGIPTRFIDGERITDKSTLEVVTAALAGLVNKEIVAAIISLGGRAIGISGVDGALLQSKIKNEEMGYTGTVVKVEVSPLKMFFDSGYIPVIAPLSLHSFDKPDKAPQLLNINADPVAGEIAVAIGVEKLIFLTDVPGVRDQSGKLLSRLSTSEAEALMDSGVISGGMIPKIKASLRAVSATSTAHIINGRQPHALLREIERSGEGTTISG